MFLLFAYSNYYPSGGWRDYKGSFPSESEALQAAACMHGVDQWHIVANGAIVREGARNYA